MVWRWQQRFAEKGLDGLLCDNTRPPGKPATPQTEVQAVLERTLTGEPPGSVTHWTGRDVEEHGLQAVQGHRPSTSSG